MMSELETQDPSPETDFASVFVILGLFAVSAITCSIGVIVGELLLIPMAFLFIGLALIANEFIDRLFPFDRRPKPTTMSDPTLTLPFNFEHQCSVIIGSVARALAIGFFGLLIWIYLYLLEPSPNNDMSGLIPFICLISTVILVPLILVFRFLARAFYAKARRSNDDLSRIGVIIGLSIGGLIFAGIMALIF